MSETPGRDLLSTEIEKSLDLSLKPGLLVCLAGAYPDASEHALPLETARKVLEITRSNVCVVHLPLRPDHMPKACLPIHDLLDAYDHPDGPIPLLNTSRATTASQALQMIESGLPLLEGSDLGKCFGYRPMIKLEVLDPNLRSRDEEVLSVLERLSPEMCRRTLPFVSPSPDIVARAVALGCPALRLLTGRIGQATGIQNPAAVREAIAAAGGRPVILEGGIDSAAHVLESAELGARAVLVNSTFRLAEDPLARAKELRQAADRAFPQNKDVEVRRERDV